MAFDRHMNLVLGDAEEFRKLPPKKGIAEEDVRAPAFCVVLLVPAACMRVPVPLCAAQPPHLSANALPPIPAARAAACAGHDHSAWR